MIVKYTVTLPPPPSPVVRGSTGITLFILDEMREASKTQARLAKVKNFVRNLFKIDSELGIVKILNNVQTCKHKQTVPFLSTLSSKIIIENCHQKFSSEIVIENFHRKLSSEIVIENCP